MAQTKLYSAPIPSDQISSFLTSKLRPALPYSLPLYRRCQFHLKTISEDRPASAEPGQPELWVTYIDRNNEQHNAHAPQSQLEHISSWLSRTIDDAPAEVGTREWLAALINLRAPAETQVWTFASWETTSPARGPDDVIEDEPRTPTRVALVKALLERIRNQHTSAMPEDAPHSWLTLLHSGKLVSQPYRRTKVLFGGIAEPLWPYLRDDIIYDTPEPTTTSSDSISTTCIARQDKPYLKYLIPLDGTTAASQPSTVPAGLRLGPLSDAHLQLMLDRSVIPRSLTLLKTLVSVGLFAEHRTEPVSWGILSKEASVASLHTEPEFRGKGLAEVISRELIRLCPETYHSRYLQGPSIDIAVGNTEADHIPYAHADVSPSNKSSRRVFEKLGGKVQWRNAWVEADLEKPQS